MSHDPQSPTDAADFEDDNYEPDGLCERCGEGIDMTEVDVESFEATGKLLCPECANDYPDVAAHSYGRW